MTYRNGTRLTWAQNVKKLRETFEKWGVGAKEWEVTRSERDRAVTVRYRPPGSPNEVTMYLDSQWTAEENLNAIALTIEAIRLQEVRGLGDITRSHYLALAAPRTVRDPYEVLGVRPDSPLEVAEAAYKALAKSAHPDAGGSEERMAELNAAIEAVRGG